MAEPERREFVSDDIVVRSPSRTHLLAAIAMTLGALPNMVPDAWKSGVLTISAFAMVPAVIALIALKRRRAIGHAGKLTLTATHLVVETNKRSRFVFPTPREGWLTKSLAGYRVLLRVRGKRVVEAALDERQALDLMRNAGIDPRRQLVRYPLAAAGRWNRTARLNAWLEKHPLAGLSILLMGGLLLVLLIVATNFPPRMVFGLLPFIFIWLAILFWLQRPPGVLVGSDGVVLEKGRYRRFVPYAEIESVRDEPNWVLLVLRDGTELELPVWQWSGQALPQDPAGRSFLADPAASRDYRVALLLHLRGAHARALQGAASDSATIPLRDGRSPAEWRMAIRRAMSEGYRRAAPTVQGLLDIVRDPRAPQEARVGAALALSDVYDAELSAELRQAIDHCASPRLRVALDQALRDELDVEVLAALDDEVRPARAVEKA